MEAPAELLAVLPALVTALALLLAWLLVRRGAAASPSPASASPRPASPAEASEDPAPPDPNVLEPAAPREPEEQGEAAESEELQAAPAKVEEQAEAKQEEEQDWDSETGPPQAGPEEEDGETFSFKYSPGKLRGNQYKKMMTKDELEEEQRIELTSDLTSL